MTSISFSLHFVCQCYYEIFNPTQSYVTLRSKWSNSTHTRCVTFRRSYSIFWKGFKKKLLSIKKRWTFNLQYLHEPRLGDQYPQRFIIAKLDFYKIVFHLDLFSRMLIEFILIKFFRILNFENLTWTYFWCYQSSTSLHVLCHLWW